MKRYLIGLSLIIVFSLLTACSSLSSLTGNGATPQPGPGTQPVNTIQQAQGVATTFLDAWQKGDYTGMYSLLSENSQASYTEQEFNEYYTNALTIMRAPTFEVQELTCDCDGEETAQFLFNVTYNSIVLGEVSQDITMFLTRSADGWAVVWDPGLILAELVGGNTLSLSVESPARANIYDANGQWMVRPDTSVARLNITTGAIDEDVEADMLTMLSEMLRLSPNRIFNQYGGAAAGQQIALGDVDLEIYQQYQAEYDSYPQLSVSVTDTTGRRYYNNGLAAHVIGYTSFVQSEQCEDYQSRGYSCDDIVGQAGIEQWGEEYLAGQRGGELNVFTPSGEYYGTVASRQPQPAESIYLTIDRDLQNITETAIADAYRFSAETWADTAGGAAVVVVDVNTGAIKAMASYPSFDPNVFHPFNNNPNATESYINDLFNSPLTPLFNRATQGAQPPGSVFKLITATAALQSPQFGPEWTYTSTGAWQAQLGGGQFIEKFDWAEEGHGTVDIAGALTVSCNSCFYEVGYRTGQEDEAYLSEWAREYHLGQEFGLPIAEVAGNIPGPGQLTSEGRQWNIADNVNMAIGQGDVLVTPLQMTMVTSVVANGGTLYQPQIVDRIALVGEDPSTIFEPIVLDEIDVPEDQFAFMREGMREVVVGNEGTAQYRLGSLGISAAGKTGTAQVSSSAQPIAWFTGFVPYDDPQYAITVMVENGGEGSVVASPIFRRIVERWYDLRVLDYPRDWADPELYEEVEDEFGD